jgi:hypothetical protein
MFKIRARRDNEPRRQDTKATSREARSADESKPQLLDPQSLKHVTGGTQTQLPRTGGW